MVNRNISMFVKHLIMMINVSNQTSLTPIGGQNYLLNDNDGS